ncbi:MAG: leucyl/phenylalanyl-tRNA--protein transferase [Acidobacteria bacterium]|nr:MAG: leucyl/phenylalanyl-tRNA--protein transferase [Acidobacteriota bacterium]
MITLDPRLRFPDPRRAAAHGLVAVGGDYHPLRLLAAYMNGIFPWPHEEIPYAWFSPDPRMVLPPAELRTPRSLRKVIRRRRFTVRYDTAFETVIERCAEAPRPDERGTWITGELKEGFLELHRLGLAHSVESWRDGRLAGGLYGLALGGLFCGESMFFDQPDASKVAFVHLVERLRDWGFLLVDCQIYSEHLARFGAREWPRDRYLDAVAEALRLPTRRGPWTEGAPAARDAVLAGR